MDDLKPCPFCGAKGRIILEISSYGRVWKCGCSKCYARTDGYYEPDDIDGYENPYQKITDMVKDVVEVWNRRYEPNA